MLVYRLNQRILSCSRYRRSLWETNVDENISNKEPELTSLAIFDVANGKR